MVKNLPAMQETKFDPCKSKEDAEDIVQDTFIQYHTMKKEFDSSEHIRAWLISFHSI